MCLKQNLINFGYFSSFTGLASSLGSYFLILSKDVTSSPALYPSNPASVKLTVKPQDLIEENFCGLIKNPSKSSLKQRFLKNSHLGSTGKIAPS